MFQALPPRLMHSFRLPVTAHTLDGMTMWHWAQIAMYPVTMNAVTIMRADRDVPGAYNFSCRISHATP
jgi:hypothetical protein